MQHDKSLAYWVSADFGLLLRRERRLLRQQTAYQVLEVCDTPALRRLFCLDGVPMTAVGDEFIYHETLVHPMAIAHPAPRTALIVGGGDGGSLRQLCRYASLQHIQVVELDAAVVRMARDYLPTVHGGAFDDPRVALTIGDGLQFMAEHGPAYDLIVLDLTDPVGAAQPLFDRAFYAACRRRLAPGGFMSLHVDSPHFQPARYQQIIAALRAEFPGVFPCWVSVPIYGGLWGMAIVSHGDDPRAQEKLWLQQRIAALGLADLHFYNADMHSALFAQPNWLAQLLQAPVAG